MAKPETATTDGNEANPAGDSGSTSPSHRHTIASLRLNVDEAQQGRPWLLLPTGVDPKKYPLPGVPEDLLRVALLPRKRGSPNGGSSYIRRAQYAYQKRQEKRLSPHLLSERGRNQAYEAASAHKAEIKKQKEEAEALMEGLRTTVATSTASLTSLYDLLKRGDEMILRGFVNNTEVNGQKVDIAAFQRTSAGIKAHVAKIGMPSEDDKGAEDEIFAEYEAAIDRTRAGIEASAAGVTAH